jgi:hypothetical protein
MDVVLMPREISNCRWQRKEITAWILKIDILDTGEGEIMTAARSIRQSEDFFGMREGVLNATWKEKERRPQWRP